MDFDTQYRADSSSATTDQSLNVDLLEKIEAGAPNFSSFMKLHSGKSYNRGVYRIPKLGDMPSWTRTVKQGFPKFTNRIFCFGYDWLGRMFALDYERKERERYLILMLEPGTGQALEIPVDFDMFHNDELAKYPNEALAAEFFGSWLKEDGKSPALNQCVGYRRPLFLGGTDTVDNLELSDLDVYWSVCTQMLIKIADLPEGTPISDIRIS